MKLPNTTWQVGSIPSRGWPASIANKGLVRLAGIAIALLAAALVWKLVTDPIRLRQLVREKTSELQESQQELKEAHDKLEQRVIHRTAKLLRSNQLLSREIRERKIAEANLRQSEEKFRLIFENSPLGILHFDSQGRITACNESFVKIIGSSHESLVGLGMLTDLQNDRVQKAIRDVLSGSPGHYEGEYKSVTAKKTTEVKCDFAPIIIKPGDSLGGIGIVEDVTQRKRAEQILQESEARFRQLVESAPFGLSVIDAGGTFEYPEWKVC